MPKQLPLRILPQPTSTTCGPTCLHAIYNYYGNKIPLSRVIKEVPHLQDGGTLAVTLGCHALQQGYRARIYTYNLHMFDPTWFQNPDADLKGYIAAQAKAKRNQKLRWASRAYLEFLDWGGEIIFQDLNVQLLRQHLTSGKPLLTGLSATYLYRSAREIPETCEYNSIKGEPTGHFVVLSGYDRSHKKLLVADPYHLNPFGGSHYYWVDIHRVISSILLGVLTYDANVLLIEQMYSQTPKGSG